MLLCPNCALLRPKVSPQNERMWKASCRHKGRHQPESKFYQIGTPHVHTYALTYILTFALPNAYTYPITPGRLYHCEYLLPIIWPYFSGGKLIFLLKNFIHCLSHTGGARLRYSLDRADSSVTDRSVEDYSMNVEVCQTARVDNSAVKMCVVWGNVLLWATPQNWSATTDSLYK